MNEKELLMFIQNILQRKGSDARSPLEISQLKEIIGLKGMITLDSTLEEIKVAYGSPDEFLSDYGSTFVNYANDNGTIHFMVGPTKRIMYIAPRYAYLKENFFYKILNNFKNDYLFL